MALTNPRRCSRRELLRAALLSGVALWLPRRAWSEGAAGDDLRRSLEKSPLIYISPLRKDGSESRCHAEVWYVLDGDDLLVVTSRDRWRARAIRQGLSRARVWVGDFGVWTQSDRFRSGPSFLAEARFEDDPAVRARALEGFGRKYADEWGKWGPRFRKGLEDGSRVLIRYRRVAG